MVINEQDALGVIRTIEQTAIVSLDEHPPSGMFIFWTAVDQLDGMLRLLGAAGVEVGGKPAWERTVAAIQAAQDRLRLAAAATTLPHPTPGAGILR